MSFEVVFSSFQFKLLKSDEEVRSFAKIVFGFQRNIHITYNFEQHGWQLERCLKDMYIRFANKTHLYGSIINIE